MTVAEMVTAAKAARELTRRNQDSKINFFVPCCRPHENKCPVVPCPESKHTKFHLSQKRIRVIFGGNRSSKSVSGMAELLFRACFKNHPLTGKPNPLNGKYRVYSSDFGIVEKMILPLIREYIPKESLREDTSERSKGESWEESYDSKYHILKLKGNATIDFMSYDQMSSKSESVELDGIWADEEMPEEIYAAAQSRLISRGGYFWMTVTPLYGISWAMKFLDAIDDNVDVFHFSIFDNPYLSEEFVKDFESVVPEHEKEARLFGRFMELKGLVYKELRADIHLIGDDQPSPGDPVIFAMDPHPRKPTVMVWAYITKRDDVVFFDELEVAGTARDVANAIRSKESRHSARTLARLIDPAARAQGNNLSFETDTLKEFEREGMGFTLADNSEAGYNITHDYLGYDQNRPISSTNRPRCFFTRSVAKTWFGMTHLLWDDWGIRRSMREDKEKIRDYKKDFPDCIRYVLASRPTQRSFMQLRPQPIGNLVHMRRSSVGPVSDPTKAEHRREFRQLIFGGRHS